MKIKNHLGLLVGVFATLGAGYVQQVNAASDLGTLSTTSTNFHNLNVVGGTGSFVDNYTFIVGASSLLTGSLTYSFSSDAYSNTLTSPPYSTLVSGLTLSKVQILNGGTVIGAGVFTSAITPLSVTPIPLPPPNGGVIYDTKETTVETVSLSNIFLTTGKTYTLEILGSAAGASTAFYGYSGNLAAIAYVIPEPGDWALLMLGLPLVGFVTYRKPSCDGLAVLQ